MAEKRMFTQKIIDSDPFLDMPLSTQALYFHLNMRADDDGFVNNPKRIQRTVGASEDDLKLLIVKRFIIGFESGVIVIKHWRMHNTLRKDRYNPTQYIDELAMLEIKENNVYTEKALEPLPEPTGNHLATTWQPNGNHLEPQYSVVESSRVESSGEESIEEPAAPTPPPPAPPKPKKEAPVKRKYGEYGWVKLTDAQYTKLLKDLGPAELERCITYVDESAQGTSNKNKWSDWNLIVRKCHREQWGIRKEAWARQRKDTGFETSNPFVEMLEEERGGR